MGARDRSAGQDEEAVKKLCLHTLKNRAKSAIFPVCRHHPPLSCATITRWPSFRPTRAETVVELGSRLYLFLLVFVAGVCSLGLELVTSSLLAPYFGTSRLMWANIIGVTLMALSVGYVWGGRLADRRPELTMLCTIIAGAEALVACIPTLSRPVLLWSLQRLAPRSDLVFLGSLLGVLALFSVPTLLLG